MGNFLARTPAAWTLEFHFGSRKRHGFSRHDSTDEGEAHFLQVSMLEMTLEGYPALPVAIVSRS